MPSLKKNLEDEVTVGFRVPKSTVQIVDILCDYEDLNRSQFFRRALDAYEPMRNAIAEFERAMLGNNGKTFSDKQSEDMTVGLVVV